MCYTPLPVEDGFVSFFLKVETHIIYPGTKALPILVL